MHKLEMIGLSNHPHHSSSFYARNLGREVLTIYDKKRGTQMLIEMSTKMLKVFCQDNCQQSCF